MINEIHIKTWLHYVVNIASLNNFPLEISINSKCVDEAKMTRYPILGVKTFMLDSKHTIMSFDDFMLKEFDNYYWKFKNEIISP